jgi:large subunit ribosomal protein L9
MQKGMRFRQVLSLSLLLVAATAKFSCAAPATNTASFVPPAAPSVVRSTPAPTDTAFARAQAVSSGYGLYPVAGSALYAKKAAGPASTSKKVQVKLLKHVAGTGQAGDVINVTPAFFNNKLRPTKAAVMISDDEVEKQNADSDAAAAETKAKATELQTKISEITLTISRKAGPEGQLFGGLSPKGVIQELQNLINDDFLNEKGVKIAELTDSNGSKIRGDLKRVGQFFAKIVLAKDISAKFSITIHAED